MTTRRLENLSQNILNEMGLDRNLVREVFFYPFKKAKEILDDKTNSEDVWFPGLFKFKLRKGVLDKTKTLRWNKKMHAIDAFRMKKLWEEDPDKYKEIYGVWYPEQQLEKHGNQIKQVNCGNKTESTDGGLQVVEQMLALGLD